MIQATYHFPRGFLWGTATAAHQVEGNNTQNNWWVWEQEPGHILNGDRSGLACDWWNGGRWREDLDHAAEAGQNAHRMSIEWSRIQPAPERWDEEALDRYRTIVRGMAARNLFPLLTLHHFSEPQWVSERGGWENEAIIDLFIAYVKKTVEALRDYVSYWVTINEPNVLFANSYLLGAFPPGQRNPGAAVRAITNLVRAHAGAYHAIHSLQPQARVGLAINYRSFQPAKAWFLPDRWAARASAHIFNDLIPGALATGKLALPAGPRRLPEACLTQDFVGVNYYTRERVAFAPFRAAELFTRRFYRPGAELSDTRFIANEPDGLFEAVKWAQQFKLPIIITENGVENADDRLRPRYLVQHLHQLWRAVNFNYPIKGYFHWTLVDNFEWERGWSQRFGLWGLDYTTQLRTRRKSADLYAEICRTNSITSESVEKYCPEVYDRLYPV